MMIQMTTVPVKNNVGQFFIGLAMELYYIECHTSRGFKVYMNSTSCDVFSSETTWIMYDLQAVEILTRWFA